MLSIRTVSAALVAWSLTVPSIAAPVPLFSNGSANAADHGLATGNTSASGVPAPAGSQWSELQSVSGSANAIAGVSAHAGGSPGSFRVADNFVVSGFAYGWEISSVSVFAYVSGGGPAFSELTVRIWSGPPDEPGSEIVWTSGTDSLLSAAPLSLYRVFNSATAPLTPPTTARQVWRLRLMTPSLTLSPGWYWLDWQVTLADAAASAFSPLVTTAGSRGPAGANAMQLKPVGEELRWSSIVDPGKPATAADFIQELPFMIEGSPATPPCVGDADGSGGVNFADVSSVLTYWGSDYLPSTGPGDGDGSGIVNFADITAVLQGWGLACN